jgi:hypothetical protein
VHLRENAQASERLFLVTPDELSGAPGQLGRLQFHGDPVGSFPDQ